MEIISSHTVMTTDIGVNDNLFGGRLMAWIDESAAAYAKEKSRNPSVVTKKVSELIFIKPAKVNDVLKIYGQVERIGNTSITIDVEARRLDVTTGEEVIMCTTSLVFVCVDNEGCPKKIVVEL